MIFNIQKCSIHDGDGLRTLVFFKGCPLRCPWCANPESQSYKIQVMENMSLCIGCGACAKACEHDAIGPNFAINHDKCVDCGKCVETCYADAKKIVGKDYTTEELFKEINKDRVFYQRLGGGVTFSGGEPLTHPKDLIPIVKMCHENGISTGMESCGAGDYEAFKDVLPYMTFMFMDIKQIDSDLHKEITGFGNEGILSNIKKISEFGVPLTIRTPVVPGYTDQKENIKGIADFILELPSVKDYELLPYHNFGVNKYYNLGWDYALDDVQPPNDEDMRELVRIANRELEGSGKACFWTKNNTREEVRD